MQIMPRRTRFNVCLTSGPTNRNSMIGPGIGVYSMGEPQPSIVLNPNQRRHFEVLFARLEDSLEKVSALLETGVEQRRLLTTVHHDVPPAFHAHAAPVIAELRRRIADLATQLSLEPRTVSIARVIGASLNAEAIRLEDSLSPQLRGYGALHASVPEQLDPVIERMAGELSGLVAALHHYTRAMRSQ